MSDEVQVKQNNPFLPKQAVSNISQGAVAIEQARALAEAQSRYQMAKMFPRNEMECYSKIQDACGRSRMAEAAIYSYNKGGKVEGASIKLVQEVARIWGNIEYGLIEISQSHGFSEMEAFACDLQTGVRTNKKFTVKHRRKARGEHHDLTDDRDIYELTANMGTRRLRAVIMQLIPSDIMDMATDTCRQTLIGNVAKNPVESAKKMIPAFKVFGVSVDMLEKKICHSLAEITPDEIVNLQSDYTALKSGNSKVSELFENSEKVIKTDLNKLTENKQG